MASYFNGLIEIGCLLNFSSDLFGEQSSCECLSDYRKGKYMEVNNQIAGNYNYGYSSFAKAKTDPSDWNSALAKSTSEMEKKSTDEKMNDSDYLEMLKNTIIKNHKLTKADLQEQDWRDLPDDEWDKLLEGIDNYIEDYKEDLKKLREIQNKAAQIAASKAPSGQKALAAANAALQAAANGFSSDVSTEQDSKWLEENSWTYDLETEDQTILTKAKLSNERADNALTKTQEILLTGDTTTGVSEIGNTRECASVNDEDGEKTWTITAFGPDGIICNQCRGGVTKELWRIDYKNSGDAQKVWDFLDRLNKNVDLKFAGSMQFWEDFLAGRVNSGSAF